MDTQTQLRLTKSVIPPGLSKVPVQIIAVAEIEGVRIVTGDTIRGLIPWDKLTDVKELAETLALCQVWQFQAACELLGQMDRMRNLFPVVEDL